MEYKWNQFVMVFAAAAFVVLILVLMEYKWNTTSRPIARAITLGLNPCFNGIQMERNDAIFKEGEW